MLYDYGQIMYLSLSTATYMQGVEISLSIQFCESFYPSPVEAFESLD